MRIRELLSLSVQELVDLSCVGGDVWTTYQWIQENGGVALEADFP
jgi:hypothetical protein